MLEKVSHIYPSAFNFVSGRPKCNYCFEFFVSFIYLDAVF